MEDPGHLALLILSSSPGPIHSGHSLPEAGASNRVKSPVSFQRPRAAPGSYGDNDFFLHRMVPLSYGYNEKIIVEFTSQTPNVP